MLLFGGVHNNVLFFVFLRLGTNVAILYGKYFFVGLYNSMFDISAKTLKTVCYVLLKCFLVCYL